jgi:hypothetical protein
MGKTKCDVKVLATVSTLARAPIGALLRGDWPAICLTDEQEPVWWMKSPQPSRLTLEEKCPPQRDSNVLRMQVRN